MLRTSYYRTALLLVIASAFVNSANGLIVRSMEAADDWQIVFYRSWFLAGALAVVFAVQSAGRLRAALRDLRPWMVVGSVFIAAVNTLFILSITHTTVANTMFLLSGAPFFAALLGRLVLGETVARGGVDRDERRPRRDGGDAVGRAGGGDPVRELARAPRRVVLRGPSRSSFARGAGSTCCPSSYSARCSAG